MVLAAGCGSSSSSSKVAVVTVALADEPSQLVSSFAVDVTDLTLTPAGGTPVAMLAHAIRVDFATLADFSLALNVTTLPPGIYDAATITLDFTTAACFLAGKTTAAALVDQDGNAPTGPQTFALDLSAAPLVVVEGEHHTFEIDFSLDHSLAVDVAGNQVVVAAAPFSRVDRNDGRLVIAQGVLKSLISSTAVAGAELRTGDGATLGNTSIEFTGTTVFQINGVASVGAAGVLQLGTQPIDTWFEAYAIPTPGRNSLIAAYIQTGKGTFNGGQDIVDGWIVDRTGGAGADAVLTVQGQSSNAAHSASMFNTAFTVATSFANTHVTRVGWSLLFDADELNVGDRVIAYGALTGTTLDALATSAVVRKWPTAIAGLAKGPPSGTTLTITLDQVGQLDSTDFTWAHGGATPPDPTSFSLDVGTLGTGQNIVLGTPVAARVFFTPVGDGGFDCTAIWLDNVEGDPVVLTLRDRANGFDVATNATGGQIQFTQTGGTQGGDETASLGFGFLGEQALPFTPDPTVVAGARPTAYVLRHVPADTLESFSSFAAFTDALNQALGGGETLHDFVAIGAYDGTTNVLAANTASAILE